MTIIILSNAIAVRPIAGKYSPEKIGDARICRSAILDISQLTSHAKLLCWRTGVRSSPSSSAFSLMKNSALILSVAAAALLAGCAQVKKPPVQARAVPTGLHFDQVGLVNLFAGEPCTPQIMFDFHGARSTTWLAAPKNETKILTDAAKKNRRVHISGKWRRGGLSNCSYVEVTRAEVTR